MNIQIQKVLHLDKELAKKNPKLHGEFLITEKYEGWFVYILYDAAAQIWRLPHSSAGRVIPAFEHTTSWFNILPKPKQSGMLIAEAYLYDTPFPILNGIFNRSKGNYRCEDVIFKCHDWVTFGDNKPAITRYKELQYLLQNNKYWKHIHPVTLLAATEYNEKSWEQYFENIVNMGGEGIIAKRASSLYSYGKRNSDLLKKKLECTVDCLATDIEIGEGEKGNLSVTLISHRKNGTKIRTVINAHKYQDICLNHPEQILDNIVSIKAMEEYEDGTLRQPVFMYPRPDKEINDYD